MRLYKRAASLAIAGALNWTVPPIAFGQQPQEPRPNASDTAEFFGTEHVPPKDRRRLAENGCHSKSGDRVGVGEPVRGVRTGNIRWRA